MSTEPPARERWRRRLPRLIVYLLVLIVLLLGLQAWQSRNLARGEAPPLVGLDPAGRPLSLADYRGRPVLVHFWATWCPVCRRQHAAIEAVAEDHPVLTVALQSGGPEAVATHVAEHDLRAPVIVDDRGELARRYGVRGVPTSFVIGPDGRIRHAVPGYAFELGLRARLWLAQ